MLKPNIFTCQKNLFIGRFIILLLTVMILSGCSIFGKKKVDEVPKSSEEIKQEIQYNEAKDFIDTKKDNLDIYWGEGIANIGDDLGNARIESKDRALKDLSEKIEVHVESDFHRVLTGSSVQTAKKYNETIIDDIIQRIKTYTNQVITSVQEKSFIDYPQKGVITYFVYIARSAYKERVQKDLDAKKMMIRNTIQNGNNEFDARNYLSAINNWISAKDYLSDFFGQLPLQDDLDNDTKMEEVNAYLYGKINNFFGNIRLTLLNDDFFYDAQGEISQRPVIYAQYIDNKGNKFSISKLPLKTEFVNGSGKIIGEVITGSYGEVELPITYINPTNKISSIRVGIDKDRITGLESFSLPPIPSVSLEMNKVKTVVMSVTFHNGSQLTEPDEIKNNVNSILLNKGFSVISILIKGNDVNHNDIEKARNTNADYLLFINAKTGSSSTVGGYENMYTTTCSGVVSLYKLPQGNVISSENIPGETGFGVSAEIAGWDAFGKLKDIILSKARSIIESI